MVITSFLINDKIERSWFFKETFLLADFSMQVVLGILFFILSKVDIKFINCELNWRLYTTIEALPSIKQVEFIRKKKFTAITLNLNNEIFVIYIAFLANSNLEIDIYFSYRAQIASLILDKILLTL